MTRSSFRDRLSAFGIRPKKGLGQNFLHDPGALGAIRRAVAQTEPEGILEIGPGPGTLTDHLASLDSIRLVAVEKDTSLVALLRAHFAETPHVEIVSGDILRTEFSDLFNGIRPTVVGNIPYNISTPILLHILYRRAFIGPVVLMLQAELAERLRAPVGHRSSGSMTVLLALLADVERILTLAPGAFFPPPKVRSEVIRINWRPDHEVPSLNLKHFETVVRTGFGQRRKTLRNALSSVWKKAELATAEQLIGVDFGRRAETLSLAEWVRLSETLTPSDRDADG